MQRDFFEMFSRRRCEDVTDLDTVVDDSCGGDAVSGCPCFFGCLQDASKH